MRASIAMAIALLACGGCYSYQTVGPERAAPDAEVRARLTIAQVERMGDVLPPDTRVIQGTVLENDGEALLLLVPVSSELRGTRMDVLNQRLRVPRGEIVELELRELDRARTGIALGAGAAVLGAVVIAAIIDTGGGKGQREPPETGERRPRPNGIHIRIPLPVRF